MLNILRTFQEEIFLALQKFSDTCENFQKPKVNCVGLKHIFFGLSFLYSE